MAKQSQVGDKATLEGENREETTHLPEKEAVRETRLPERPEELGQEEGEFELKERLDPERFIAMMRQVTDALSNRQSVELKVDGQSCEIPVDTVLDGKLEVEYEYEDGEYELEFTMKWRE